MRIRSVISFHPSKLWKAKFSIQGGYIFWWGCRGNLELIANRFCSCASVRWSTMRGGYNCFEGRRARGGRVAGWIWQLMGTRNKQEPPTTPHQPPTLWPPTPTPLVYQWGSGLEGTRGITYCAHCPENIIVSARTLWQCFITSYEATRTGAHRQISYNCSYPIFIQLNPAMSNLVISNSPLSRTE